MPRKTIHGATLALVNMIVRIVVACTSADVTELSASIWANTWRALGSKPRKLIGTITSIFKEVVCVEIRKTVEALRIRYRSSTDSTDDQSH